MKLMSVSNETPIRILVLEDDETLREMLREELEDRGYQVETADRGQKAVDLARQKSFQLVVADIRMEGMDGLTALEGVKEHQPDVGSMVITGYTSEAESIRAVQLQVGEYLKKPFRLPNFMAAVERLLARHLEEKRRVQQARDFRRTVMWSLENLAGPNAEAGKLAARLASAKGLGQDFSEDLQMATLLHLVGLSALPDFLKNGLSPALLQLQNRAGERWDGSGPGGLKGEDIPLGSRIISLAVAKQKGEPLDQGGFDPELIELLGAPAEEEEDEGPAPESGRSLLSMARVLDETGDASGAEKTYEEVHQRYPATLESAIASLALARLNAKRGQPEKSVAWAQRAVKAGEVLGPVTWAEIAVEAGLLLARSRHPSGVELLNRVRPHLEEFQSEQNLARVNLALAHFAGKTDASLGTAAQVLARPENTAILGPDAGWILELLLGASNLAEPGHVLLKRVVRDCSSSFQALLTNSQTAPAVVLRGLTYTAGIPEADELLQALEAHSDAQVRQAASKLRSDHGGSESQLPLLRIYALGGFRVYLGEERLDKDWKRQKSKLLLAYLAGRDTPVSDDALLEALWPKSNESSRNRIHTTTYYLRRLLSGGKDREHEFLIRRPEGLMLNPDLPVWHDLTQLEKELGLADAAQKAGRSNEVGKHLAEAARVYQGPYLETCFLDWAVRRRDRLESKMTQAFLHLATGFGKAGRAAEAVEFGQRALELNPCSQDAYLAVMNGFIALGRPEEAVRLYDTCEKVLKREMEMEPSIPLFEALQRAKLSIV